MGSGPRAIVIVGGGLMGLSTAFHLRRAAPQARVTVLERGRVGDAASGASAAGVRVMGRHRAERALALESLRRWPELDRELEATTGYRRGGGLRVALDDAGWAEARATVGEQRADGVPVELGDGGATSGRADRGRARRRCARRGRLAGRRGPPERWRAPAVRRGARGRRRVERGAPRDDRREAPAWRTRSADAADRLGAAEPDAGRRLLRPAAEPQAARRRCLSHRRR